MHWNLIWVQILALYGSWALVKKWVQRGFKILEQRAPSQMRARTISLLKNADGGKLSENMAHVFADSFDVIFGPRAFSVRCFLASCICSYCMTALMILAMLGLYGLAESDLSEKIEYVLVALLWTTFVNIIPDYISLIKTRKLLNAVHSGRSLRICTIIDMLVSATIGYVAVGLLSRFFDRATFDAVPPIGFHRLQSFGTVVSASSDPLSVGFQDFTIINVLLLQTAYSIWFYTTFFTSIWLFLFGASTLLVKYSERVSSLVKRLRQSYDIEKKPFESIGSIIVTVLTVLWVAMAPLIILLRVISLSS